MFLSFCFFFSGGSQPSPQSSAQRLKRLKTKSLTTKGKSNVNRVNASFCFMPLCSHCMGLSKRERMSIVCEILAPFLVFDGGGKFVARLEQGQTWCGSLNSAQDFIFWVADGHGILRRCKVPAIDTRIKIKQPANANAT